MTHPRHSITSCLRRSPMLAVATVIAMGTAIYTAVADAEPRLDGDARVRVCAKRLEVDRRPNAGYDGFLKRGQSFRIRKLSHSGKYAYGLAYGHVNRVRWVRTGGLCGTGTAARASAVDRLVGERVHVCAKRLTFTRRPNHGWDGVLKRRQSFRVRKLSRSHKYAYGLAYGHINRTGWVRTGGLCGGSGDGPVRSN